MNAQFNENAKVEQLAKMFLNREEEKGFIVKGPFLTCSLFLFDDLVHGAKYGRLYTLYFLCAFNTHFSMSVTCLLMSWSLSKVAYEFACHGF